MTAYMTAYLGVPSCSSSECRSPLSMLLPAPPLMIQLMALMRAELTWVVKCSQFVDSIFLPPEITSLLHTDQQERYRSCRGRSSDCKPLFTHETLYIIFLKRFTLIDICLTLMALILDIAAISARIQSGQSSPPQNVNFIWKQYSYSFTHREVISF